MAIWSYAADKRSIVGAAENAHCKHHRKRKSNRLLFDPLRVWRSHGVAAIPRLPSLCISAFAGVFFQQNVVLSGALDLVHQLVGAPDCILRSPRRGTERRHADAESDRPAFVSGQSD